MEKRIFIDFDGVILDTQYFITKNKQMYPNLSWDEYLKIIDWHKLINDSNEINDSIQILKFLKNKKNLYILTKVYTLEEAKEKIIFLRSKEIELPIFIVPPQVQKPEIVLPNYGDILVDDYIENIKSWTQHGGHGILFDNNGIHDDIKNVEKQKSLRFLREV